MMVGYAGPAPPTRKPVSAPRFGPEGIGAERVFAEKVSRETNV